MRVIVTRPAAQAADWVAKLLAYGIDAQPLALIGIAPALDAAAVPAAWEGLHRKHLVVFVSPNAAEQFFAGRPTGATWPDGVLAGSPGPGTTQTLRALGVPPAGLIEPAADAVQFDSETLWEQLAGRDWSGANVLIVRGDSGREWLADTLRRHGAQVDAVTAYRRCAPVFGAAECELLNAAIRQPAGHLWFFSSSEAIDNLAALVASADLPWRQAHALATHPRIAERARQRGFKSVTQARPTLSSVVACIQSIRP